MACASTDTKYTNTQLCPPHPLSFIFIYLFVYLFIFILSSSPISIRTCDSHHSLFYSCSPPSPVLPSTCACHGPCQACGLWVRIAGLGGCLGLPVAVCARGQERWDLLASIFVWLFVCLYACVLVCLFARLTRHPPFNNAQPSDPTLTLSCYPGVLLFLLACAGRFACSLWKGTARRCLPCLRSARVSPACVPEARRK